MARRRFFDHDTPAVRRRTQSPDVPHTTTAVAADVVTTTIATIDPRIEDSHDTWARWSREREERERVERMAIEAATEKAAKREIYCREIAETIADDVMKLVPDWRLLRPEVVEEFMRIVKQQPEYRQKEIVQRDNVVRLIQDHLPTHLHSLMRDLQTINDLITLARESSAFLVGHVTGWKARSLHIDAHGRLRAGMRPNRGPLRMGLGDVPIREPQSRTSQAAPAAGAPPLVSLPKEGISLQAIQKAAIIAALNAEDWSQARAAERLTMAGGALNQRMKHHHIEYPPEHAHKRRPRRTRALARAGRDYR